MFLYYLNLAFRSLKRTPILTGLMVLAIALGIGATMTAVTVWHVLSGNPIPRKSSKIYCPQLDPRDRFGYAPGVAPPGQVTWIDGMNLLRAGRAEQQALMTGGSVAIQLEQSHLEPFLEPSRFTTAGFFPMFDVRFRYGHPWNARDDDTRARVVAISGALNQRLFAGKDSTGETLRLDGHDFRIIGVLGDWRPNPQFYDLTRKRYNEDEGVYVPLSTSQDVGLAHEGDVECWGNGGGVRMNANSPCVWLQLWVELDTPQEAVAYQQFLVHYSEAQRALGRFQRLPNVRLHDVMQWLDDNRVVPEDVGLQVWLGFGFLLVCLFNTLGLMLARFMRQQADLSVRRALGASRADLFAQLLVEAAAVGIPGGIGGLCFAMSGLWVVRHQPTAYAPLVHLGSEMFLVTCVLSIIASLAAGLVPATRASYVAPALQLKCL